MTSSSKIAANAPSIDLSPSNPVLVDTRISICIRHAIPGEQYHLTLLSTENNEQYYAAEATFTANADGVIDLDVNAPNSGDYGIADSMGLFWSRKPFFPLSGDVAEKLYAQQDTEQCLLSVYDNNGAFAEMSFTRLRKLPNILHDEINEPAFYAHLYAAPSNNASPIIVLGGSSGGFFWNKPVAALLASHGLNAMALAYFAHKTLPQSHDRIALEYFDTAIEWLKHKTRSSHVGLMGICRGAEAVLSIAARRNDISAVVAYSPTAYRWGGAQPDHSGWTLNGIDLPYIRNALSMEQRDQLIGMEPYELVNWFKSNVEHASEEERTKARIPVESIRAKLMLIHGANDAMWPSHEFGHEIATRYLTTHAPSDLFTATYSDAGHRITWPYKPMSEPWYHHNLVGCKFAFGGSAQADAQASEDSWQRVLRFLLAESGKQRD